MTEGPFTVAQKRPAREGYTISRPVMPGAAWFSLGAGTSISPECYDHPTLYLIAEGSEHFILPEGPVPVGEGDALLIDGGTLCGMQAEKELIYTEILLTKETVMNNKIKAGQPFALKDMIGYEEGSITNLDICSSPAMKYVLMAFDEGTGLTPHRAPGNAIVTALEGRAVIGYEGQDFELEAGQCFRFEKNGLHSVTAQGRFKMSLLLVFD